MYEQGCVCDLDKLDYNNGKLIIPNQNGFMYLALDSMVTLLIPRQELLLIS